MSNQEISCQSCIGACCSDVQLQLSYEELCLLEEAETNLEVILPCFQTLEVYENGTVSLRAGVNWGSPEGLDFLARVIEIKEDESSKDFWKNVLEQARQMKEGEGLFAMFGKCGFLQDDGSCGNYENRPEICKGFSVGGIICKDLRERAGVSTPIELTAK